MHLWKMALHCVLAVFMCELLPRLQSRRISLGSALEPQSSGHAGDTDVTAVLDGGKLLACEVVETKQRFVILAGDKPFWEYYYAKGNYFSHIIYGVYPELYEPRSINCQTYTHPPKASIAFRNLTTPHLPEEMISLIASFDNSSVHCSPCGLVSFRMKFLENCSAPTTAMEFMEVHRAVKEEGGYCFQASWSNDVWQTPDKDKWGEKQTLSNCMRLNSFNKHWSLETRGTYQDRRVLASCTFESDTDNEEFIKEKRAKIKENQEENLGLQKAIDTRKQDVFYLKHIFEGQ